jgi:hypothetical protein
LLAAHSSVFRKMIEKKSDRREIAIPDLKPHVMYKILEFLYTNQLGKILYVTF